MAGKWLSEADRSRISGWPETVVETDLFTYFTLSEADRRLIAIRRRDSNRLGFAVSLCALRFLGFFPREDADIPGPVLTFLSAQLEVPPESRGRYATRGRTRTDHEMEILAALGYRRQTGPDRHELVKWLTQRALEHDRPMALLRMAAERLRAQRILRPGLDFLERDVASARFAAMEILWTNTRRLLTPKLKAELDSLLTAPEGKAETEGKEGTKLAWLKEAAVSHEPDEIKQTLAKIDWLVNLGVKQWNIGFFTPNRLKYLAGVGKRSNAQTIKRLRAPRRYPLLIAFLSELYAEALDTLIDQYDRFLFEIQSKSVREFEQLKAKAAVNADDRRRLLAQVGRILIDPKVPADKVRESVFGVVPESLLKRVITECDIEERPENDWPADRIASRINRIHQFSYLFLSTVAWKGVPEAASLIKAIRLVERTRGKGGRGLPEDAPTDFIPLKWRRFVCPEPKKIDLKYYELCALWELRTALRAGTIWAEGARRFADPARFLIRPRDWPKLKADVLVQTTNPATAGPRLKTLTEDLNAALTRLNKELDSGTHVRLDENGDLSLSRLDADARPFELESFRSLIVGRLPRVELAELLIEIDQRLRFSDQLIHVTNHKRVSDIAMPSLYAALLGLGGNFGPARMSQMTSLPEKSIANRTNLHLRRETLSAATAGIVNFCHRHPLTKSWGDGTLSSSDGQRFETSGKNLSSRPNPKYFGYGRGVTAYTWISDQYMLYGTKIISTNLRDATFILDGILDNQSDLPIREHTSDSHGYTEITFALFSLLGLQFSPRIKDLGSQRLYRIGKIPDSPASSLLEGKINTTLIERHWDDLLRLAGSLKLGFVSASSIISRLHAAPRKNPLVRALQEYGRLTKTLFIVRYLGSKDFRRRINGQLNRGEAEHALWAFIFTGRESKFHKHTLEDLNDQGECVSLIANAVQAWNTVYMAEILDQMRTEGHQIDESLLKYVSPHCYEHINPYGKISFPIQQIMERTGLRPLRDPQKENEDVDPEEENDRNR
jgi:TnpA family transposase